MKNIFYSILILFICNACGEQEQLKEGTFGYDLHFLKKHKETIILKNNNGKCQVAVIPDFQGRIMTSTSNGESGKSYGWINTKLVSSKILDDHMNAFGGEDRIWLGPEGGQYSIFFKKGSEFTLANWHVPKSIDAEPFTLEEHSETNAVLSKELQVTNYQGYNFNVKLRREISILDKETIKSDLGIDFDDKVSYVGFQSDNKITNTGDSAWSKESGLLSLWILGMYTPSENTTVIIPYKDSLQLNTSYFGAVSSDRLTVNDETILFKGDGKYRSKIGLPAFNALPVFGSFDSKNNVLTIVKYTLTEDSSYVNSLWKIQDDPYNGDVINSYNDGSAGNGKQLGPFYELESSSAAKELQPDESITHVHKTFHFEGEFESLNKIAQKVLHISLNEISFEE